ncbi:glycoside hydrolase family 6 protein [Streptomyces sp. NPDC002758]
MPPTEAASGAEWRNPKGRALGARPTAATANSLVDAWLWAKHPGESDGSCQPGEPLAGTWWPSYRLGLAHSARW